MTDDIRTKLRYAEIFCKKTDKTLSETIGFMADYANVSIDCVMDYLREPELEPTNTEEARQ